MSNFLKKAMGLFVEFEPDDNNNARAAEQHHALSQKFPLSNPSGNSYQPVQSGPPNLSEAELDKFEQHFSALFEKSNLPGPDYYEFWKMMETLEAHVKDENARMAAVYATLSIQGLTKNRLIESAAQYKQIIEQDKAEFEKAASSKAATEVDGRNQQLEDLSKKMADNAALIQQLTKEIAEAQTLTEQLKGQIAEQEAKIHANTQGYQVACEAMLRKINTDIQKINTSL
ncbi:hypothetical protein DVR12_08245 [Chitinophaga silvatica]|uniref:DUF4047 domain-containing protein n=1 Tax=Chitinophaga silvatica TaxID=2282649 RepID=A0A3E1YCA6_9BACT|nr:hypothetical protein [Chitinophaga silvatica]RFS23870.1 hypothetical protein DVR12_08245 [Chitinophaga silvatica]